MNEQLGALTAVVRRSPARYLAVAFLLANLFETQAGGVNPWSRLAMARAMTRTHTFRIDEELRWTCDWSRTPDGAYYSNKAPGPAFLALPFELALSAARVSTSPAPSRPEGAGHEPPPGALYSTLLAVLLQAVPFALLVILGVEALARAGVSTAGQLFGATAALFGNTAAALMNTFFGHALAATALLAACVALAARRYFWVGMSLGWALLSDYGVLATGPGAILTAFLVLRREEKIVRWRAVRAVALGALAPAALWAWYHTTCFGSPWALPFASQNPLFVEQIASHDGAWWGVIRLLPPPDVVVELVVGKARGLVVTQPWLLLVIGAIAFWIWRARAGDLQLGRDGTTWLSGTAAFAGLGFVGLFWMNAGFNGWHGGAAPGPRYMSIIFPLFALLGGVVYDRFQRSGRALLWSALAVAVALQALICSGDVRAPHTRALWSFYAGNLAAGFPSAAWARLSLFVVLGVWAVTRTLDLVRVAAPALIVNRRRV